MSLLFEKESYKIIGAAQEVHRELGSGFLEAVYQEALAIELTSNDIEFEKEKKLEILYKGTTLEKYYIADFVCFNKIILEIKTVSAIDNNHLAQVINYLKATGFNLGFIINFGAKSLEFKRVVYN
jgi:GxxExxY protein